MDAFLEPLPSPQPSFVAGTYDPELTSILAALLAMHEDDDDVREPPPRADEYLPADSAAALPAFVHQHDQPTSMSFPTVASRRPLPPPHTVDAHHEATATAGASRPVAKRKRRGKKPTSSPSGSSTTRASRQVWVRARSTEWWDHLNGASCTDAEFRRAFRMSRATFGALCDALGGAVAREDTTLRAAIPVRRRVAACVWRLATAEPLREVSRRFGLGISTCHTIVLQVCHALAAVLLPISIHWPDATSASQTVGARFEAVSGGLPGVVGAVYTTRVPIVAPNKGNVAPYYDSGLTERIHKASYSVAVQAVSDADGAFTDVCIGFPGSLSDADVLARSALCQLRGEAGLLSGGGHTGKEQQRLVGGASYPLTEWMLVPYAAHQNDMTWTQQRFNEGIAAARDVARGAVRRLKARWRCLQRRTEAKMEDLPTLIAACCELHNVCERAGEGIDPDLMRYELDDDDDIANDAASSVTAVQVRDRIAHGLLHGSSSSCSCSQYQ